jgi:site-specific recombinase XerD
MGEVWKFPHAIELFDKYKSENPKDRHVIDRKYLIEDQAFNRNLKVIAKHLEWDFNLYNKMGRTTNAQLYIRFGANPPTVSKMLGHEKESTTETYFTINLADVIEGTKGVDFKKT